MHSSVVECDDDDDAGAPVMISARVIIPRPKRLALLAPLPKGYAQDLRQGKCWVLG